MPKLQIAIAAAILIAGRPGRSRSSSPSSTTAALARRRRPFAAVDAPGPVFVFRFRVRDDCADKTITSAWNRFNVAWVVGVVAECHPYLADDRVEAHVERDRVGGPALGRIYA